MTDHNYIAAFRSNDQQGINSFYARCRSDFRKNISRKFNIKDEDLLSDIFQDSVIRLWRNIQDDKLTEENLTTTLSGYLYGVGERVALEYIRKNKEITLNSIETPIVTQPITEDPYFVWLAEVEEPMRLFAPSHTHEECVAEWERRTNLYKQSTQAKSMYATDILQGGLPAFEQEERYRLVRNMVSQMGQPCAPLLLKFYWENLSWEKIAQDLNYANANSAKTQKNKCMNKLKTSCKSHESYR